MAEMEMVEIHEERGGGADPKVPDPARVSESERGSALGRRRSYPEGVSCSSPTRTAAPPSDPRATRASRAHTQRRAR